MAATNNGVVFFLGTKAHYQVLTPTENQNFDLDNGNQVYEEPSAIFENYPQNDNFAQKLDNYNFLSDSNKESIIDIEEKAIDFGEGVKRRLKKNRKQDGSSELILNNDNDYDPSALNDLDSDSKTRRPKRGRVSLAYFLTLLGGRKKSDTQHLKHLECCLRCSYRDSCRCLDCQSRYFECDDDEELSDEYPESDGSVTPDLSKYDEEPSPEQLSESESEHLDPSQEEDDNDEVFIDTPPANATSTEHLLEVPPPRLPSEVEADDEDIQLELAAGAPLLLNHLLNNPITCAIQ